MWIAILITLFLGGFLFHALATYHRNLERRHFPLITSRPKLKLSHLRPKLINFWTKSKLQTLENKLEIEENQIKNNTKLIIHLQPHEPKVSGEGLYLFEELGNSILYTYGMLTLVSLPKIPIGWALRIMTGWWWMYCLLVVVSYRASMTASLANPAPK